MTILQTFIAFDQFLNTLINDAHGGVGGWADETISSRAWRLRGRYPKWRRICVVIDWVALRVFRDPDHCLRSFVSERNRLQSPPEERGPPLS